MVGDSCLTELVKRVFEELRATGPRDTYVPLLVNPGLGKDLSIERDCIIHGTRKIGIKDLPKLWKRAIYGIFLNRTL